MCDVTIVKSGYLSLTINYVKMGHWSHIPEFVLSKGLYGGAELEL